MRLIIAFLYILVFLPVNLWAGADDVQPEAGSGLTHKKLVESDGALVVTAHPSASMAAKKMLDKGGSAVDAAIAAQLVLNIVEPQSSGIGGGGFMLYYNATEHSMKAYDGREIAPAGAKSRMFIDATGEPYPFLEAVQSGRAVGVPGMVDLMWKAHQAHGLLPWEALFTPALILAEDGYRVSPRLHQNVMRTQFDKTAPAVTMFLDEDGNPYPVGKRLTNEPFAQVLRMIARGGRDAFYKGEIAEHIVEAVTQEPKHPGNMHTDDLKYYRTKLRELVCLPYRSYRVCSMPPPSSGGVTLLQALGFLSFFDMDALEPNSVEAVHVMTEAMRLAFADRNRYLADPDFVPVPVARMLAPEYLAARAALIRGDKALGDVYPGEFMGSTSFVSLSAGDEKPSTTHLSIVDAHGNAVSMTSSIEFAFGSGLVVDGFILNNQLTDFSFVPEQEGRAVANRVEAGKRPRSSMSPTFVFDADDGQLTMVIGSPGGARIIPYVFQTIVNVLDWEMDIQEAINQPRFVHVGAQLDIEQGSALEAIQGKLEKLGHKVSVRELPSGLHGIVYDIEHDRWQGGADPRRDGMAIAVQ